VLLRRKDARIDRCAVSPNEYGTSASAAARHVLDQASIPVASAMASNVAPAVGGTMVSTDLPERATAMLMVAQAGQIAREVG